MQWFNQLRVTTRLVAGFLVVAVIGAVMGLLGVINMGRMAEWTGKIYHGDLQALKAVQDANINLVYASRAQIGLLSASTMGERATEKEQIARSLGVMDERIRQVAKAFEQPEGKALVKQYHELSPAFRARMEKYVEPGQQAAAGYLAVREPGVLRERRPAQGQPCAGRSDGEDGEAPR